MTKYIIVYTVNRKQHIYKMYDDINDAKREASYISRSYGVQTKIIEKNFKNK